MTTENSVIVGYARVSSRDQNLDRQIMQLLPLITNERYLFQDKQSGRNFDRPEYQRMKDFLRRGDTHIICSLDRLGRNATEMEKEWKELTDRGIYLRVLDMPILDTKPGQDTMNQLVSKVVFDLLSYIAQMEREKIRERQREGIAAAKKAGRPTGRPRIEFPKNWAEIIKQYESGDITAQKAQQDLNLKPGTFYNLLRRYRKR